MIINQNNENPFSNRFQTEMVAKIENYDCLDVIKA